MSIMVNEYRNSKAEQSSIQYDKACQTFILKAMKEETEEVQGCCIQRKSCL